ncbi:MAG: hypothetical protein EA351_05640 [Gemmatimonadales bacterium]|nr:MAG: hypothetical protein EA351_05640 [Gemmatimonadales bacterium]
MIPSIRGSSLAGGLLAVGALFAAGGLWSLNPAEAGPMIPAPAPTTLLSGDTISTLEGVFTEEQARAGKQVYDVECSLCHGPQEFSGRLFQLTWTGQPLSSIYRHISLAMPLDNPGGLATEQYVAVLAYILELNGYPAGDATLPASVEELGQIRMERLPEPDTGSLSRNHTQIRR